MTVYVLEVGHTGSKPVYILFGLDYTDALDADAVRQLCTSDAQGIEYIPSPCQTKGTKLCPGDHSMLVVRRLTLTKTPGFEKHRTSRA